MSSDSTRRSSIHLEDRALQSILDSIPAPKADLAPSARMYEGLFKTSNDEYLNKYCDLTSQFDKKK